MLSNNLEIPTQFNNPIDSSKKLPPWEELDINVNLPRREREASHAQRELSPHTRKRALIELISEKNSEIESIKHKIHHLKEHWEETTKPLLLERYQSISRRITELMPHLEEIRNKYTIAKAEESKREHEFRKVETIYERQKRALLALQNEISEVLNEQRDRQKRMDKMLQEIDEIEAEKHHLTESINRVTALTSIQHELGQHALHRANSFLDELRAAAKRIGERRIQIRQLEDTVTQPLEQELETARSALRALEQHTARLHTEYARVHTELINQIDRATTDDFRLQEIEFGELHLLQSRQEAVAWLEAQAARAREGDHRRIQQPDRTSVQWASEKLAIIRELIKEEQKRRDRLLRGRSPPPTGPTPP